jgi:hypothetical protein
MRNALLWILVGAAAVAAAFWVLAFWRGPAPASPEWDVSFSGAWVVGSPDDPYAYSGGSAVQSVEGQGRLLITGASIDLSMSVDLPSGAWLTFLGVPQSASHRLDVRLDTEVARWPAGPVYGDTGYGGAALPTTTAVVSGDAVFSLLLPGSSRTRLSVPGVWSLAQAIRQSSDGSIRQQGLYYSPLLRDKTGFSDPTRLEMTVILSLPDSKVMTDFILVFRDITVTAAPNGVTLP